MPKTIRMIAWALFLLLSTDGFAFAAEPFALAIGTSSIKYFQSIKESFEKESGLKVKFLHEKGLSADSALLALDQGRADVAVAGIDWKGWLDLMEEKHLKLSRVNEEHALPIGKEPILIATYKGGPKALSDDQIKKLFSGEAKSWKDVGGEDIPVQIVLMVNTNALQKLFCERFLGGAQIYTRGVKIFNDAKSMSQFIGETQGAIGVGTTSMEVGLVNMPKHSEINRPITLVYSGERSRGVQKLLEFIKKNPMK